ncbi:NAD-reducing hydrogenase HoxS subunit alpha [bacterium BMS3Abin01]|nr:NAD-reducing hydrogenase HoxS subunit alpha [bacterium BMS3Abin01]
MTSGNSEITEDGDARLLVEALRTIQEEDGVLTGAALRELASEYMVSPSRLYGVAATCPEFSFEAAVEDRRPQGPPVEEPEFFNRIIRAGHAQLVVSGALTQRFAHPPATIEAYVDAGGMGALARASGDMKPEHVLSEIVLGKITRKDAEWQAAAVTEQPFIIANCHAGDPIAGQATTLLDRDAYSVLEGMHCAAVALGARHGFLYTANLTGEEETRLNRTALDIAAAADGDFAVTVVPGVNSLVGSEDSVARAVIDGRRPVPSAQRTGVLLLRGRAAVIDSAEMFANVTAVLASGEPAGTRLYRVTGAVDRPGIIEADASATVRELAERAGTHAGAQALVGGLSGAFLTEGQLDQRMSVLKPADNPRWRTVHMLRDRRDIFPNAREMAAYNARYLCGRCVPCRIGSVRMAEMIEAFPPDAETLAELAETLVATALCPVGRGAAGMIRSALKRII